MRISMQTEQITVVRSEIRGRTVRRELSYEYFSFLFVSFPQCNQSSHGYFEYHEKMRAARGNQHANWRADCADRTIR